MGIKKIAKSAAAKVGNSVAAISALSPKQVSDVEKKRRKFLAEKPDLQDEEANKFISARLGAVGIEVYQAYFDQLKTIYKPIQAPTSFDGRNFIRSFDITKWVLDVKESSLDKLINVYHVLSEEKCNIALIYHRTVEKCCVTLGVVNTDPSRPLPTVAESHCSRLIEALRGNFPGAEITEKISTGVPDVLKNITDENVKQARSVAFVSNLASEKSEKFISQSMEKLLDGIVPSNSNEEYTIVLMANPIVDQLGRMNRLFELYSELMPYSSWQINYTSIENFGLNAGANIGINSGINFGFDIGEKSPVKLGFNLGSSFGRSSGAMTSIGKTDGITQNCANFAVQHTLDVIKNQLKRIEESSALGMWEFAAYVVSQSPVVANNVAHMYLALTQGEESYMTRSSVNLWDGEVEHGEAEEILKSIQRLCHPKFGLAADSEEWLIYPAIVTPSVMLSGKELAKALNFPRKSVTGLPVIECAEFGRNIVTYDNPIDGDKLHIGKIFHMNHVEEENDVSLNMNSLASHTFVTGSTNAGKSNTVYKILDEAQRKNVKFLVVEPAKGEYKKIFGKIDGVSVYGTNSNITPLLRLNPFSFSEEKIHVLEHLDRLVEIFNVCWPMYAAMPAVLKNAVEKSYEDCGWNLTESTNEFGKNRNMYPCFADVARNVKAIIDSSEYDTDNKGAYKGALLTRLNSLTNGINGLIFQNDEIPAKELFDENVIVDLSRVGSMETKSLIMGMMVLKLQEYRMSIDEMNAELRHLTVLEEAHNLLKRTSTEQITEGSNLLGKSVELISNAIAEMRTYGEGFIIVDQAPGLLDMSVIRNTNTKIIMRLPDQSDRELVGRAANLNDSQITELAKLPKGVAAVYQNEWIQPILCKVKKSDHKEEPYNKRDTANSVPDDPEKRLKIAELLSNGTAMEREVILNNIAPILEEMKIVCSVRTAIFKLLQNPPKEPRMTKLAPIMSVLFPNVRKSIESAYSESRKPMDWTVAGENELKKSLNTELQDQVRRDIIQAIVIDYVFNKLGKSDEVEHWTKEGLR